MKQKSPLKKRLFSERLPLLLSFFLPFFITFICFAANRLYPFGDHMIFCSDAWHQYYPFLVAFRDKLLNGGSLQYTWSVGMGTGFLSLFAYYLASPLFLLSALVPLSLLREFFWVMTVLKLASAGLFFGIFLRTVYRRNDMAIPFFALMYALCSWACGYYWNIMWLDVFALLPLLIAGTVALLRDGKFRLYILALALSLWSNYYVAYFCCIFVLLCFIGFCITCWHGWKNFFRRFVRIGVCTVVGAGIAAVLLIPTLKGMQGTYSSAAKEVRLLHLNIAEDASGIIGEDESVMDVLLDETIPGVFEATRKVLSNLTTGIEPTDMSGLPNVFCSFSAVVLGLFYLTCGKIKLREKIFNLLLLGFLILSFIFRFLDYAWHGFHFTNMLPYRFSFLFCFVLIAMAYRAFTLMDTFKPWKLAVIVPLAALILYNSYAVGNGAAAQISVLASRQTVTVIFSGLVLAGMIAVLLVYKKSSPLRKTVSLCILAFFITCEMILSMAVGTIAVGTTVRSSYPKQDRAVQELLALAEEREAGNPFWRTEMTVMQTLNDGALNGFNGVTIFTSSANVNFNRFSRSLGLSSWAGSNRYSYSEGTPFTNLMCGIKYLLDRDGKHYNTDYNTLISTVDNTNLLENSAYAGIGFMTDGALADFVAEEKKFNPILEQEEMFRLATGIDAELYTHLKHTSLAADDDDASLTATGTSGTQYSYSTGADGKTTFSISYRVEKAGLYCATTKTSGTNSVTVYCNDEKRFSLNIKARSLFSLGNFEEGDYIWVQYVVDEPGDSTISLDVALQNNEVLDAGLETLQDEQWVLTECSDTYLKGSITALEGGLFYTSIPYEDGWTAYVDGQEVALARGYDPKAESVPLTNAVISFTLPAGTHEIELRYTTPGLKLGAVISAVSTLIFAAGLIFLRKKPVLLPDRWSRESLDALATQKEEESLRRMEGRKPLFFYDDDEFEDASDKADVEYSEADAEAPEEIPEADGKAPDNTQQD